MNSGSTGTIISDEMSVNIDTTPRATTLGGMPAAWPSRHRPWRPFHHRHRGALIFVT